VDPTLARLLPDDSKPSERALLSKRERELLSLLAEGLSGEEAAARLFLSPETVRTHIRNAMRKLNAKTRVHALALALRHDELSL
jgi:DNA-binding CsgD family transcriptional regulator